MTRPSYLDSGSGRQIAYRQTVGKGPGVVFLGGFKSDMEGTKAVWLEKWAKSKGRAFLRLDYSGHGLSSGVFEEGCIGAWLDDARAVIQARCDGPQVLVGSSMGGWISTLLVREIPEMIAGIVGIAAAPDFTEDGIWGGFSVAQKAELTERGQVALPSDYGEPYIITKKLIEDGRAHLVLREPLKFSFPVRLLQGTADKDVDIAVALRLMDHATGDDIRLTLVKGADHRFSTPECLELIVENIEDVLRLASEVL